MITMKKALNFTTFEVDVQTWSTQKLWGAILDIAATLPAADALDCEFGTDDGGFYRDQASVIRREIARRNHS
jgi:hypothetical protein